MGAGLSTLKTNVTKFDISNWYTGDPVYDKVLFAALAMCGSVFVAAPLVQAPYGRFASSKYGISVNPRLGWFLMELPASLSFWYFFLKGPNRSKQVPKILALIWTIHYLNRGFIFPYMIRVSKNHRTTFSFLVILSGWLATSLHGYLNGRFFSSHGKHLANSDWLKNPKFLIGLTIYYAGFLMNIHSDAILRNLRPKNPDLNPDERSVYKIPYGGLFEYVSSPSYFSELVGWFGFSVMTWSLSGVYILAISAGNLIPRAFETHKWYLQKFPDYPKARKVLIPFLL